MRIFVAGGTGVIGRPAVAGLVAAGHDVTVLARTPERADQVRAAGAAPARVDLFDPDGLRRAVAGHDAVVNLATHIPPLSRMARPEAWVENNRIRQEGSANLVDAALAAGVRRFVQESLAFYYRDSGSDWIAAGTPLAQGPAMDAGVAAVTGAEASVARFTAAGGDGVVLRFGRFYDASSTHTVAQVRAATLGVSAEVGTPDGYQPLIAVADAASAVVAALDAPSGTYDVVDDDPLTRRQIDDVLAAGVGRSRLRRPLDRLQGRLGTMATVFQRSNRVSNRAFREATSWRPAAGGSAAGLSRLVRELGYGGRGLRGVVRVCLWILALSGLAVGVQALFTPESFYDDFPFGRGWVAADPPYNEHLVRDVGAFNLALASVTLVALAIRSPLAARLSALAWFVFSAAHGTYHLAHLHGFGTGDAIGIVVGTVGPAVLALVVLLTPDRRPQAVAPTRAAPREPAVA